MSPFEIMYIMGARVSLPLELATSKLQTIIEDVYFQDSLEKRIIHLMRIDEERDKLVNWIKKHKMMVKKIFDKRARP